MALIIEKTCAALQYAGTGVSCIYDSAWERLNRSPTLQERRKNICTRCAWGRRLAALEAQQEKMMPDGGEWR